MSLPYNLIKSHTLQNQNETNTQKVSPTHSQPKNEIYSNIDNKLTEEELEEKSPKEKGKGGRNRMVKGSLIVSGSQESMGILQRTKNKSTLEMELENFNNCIRQEHLNNIQSITPNR